MKVTNQSPNSARSSSETSKTRATEGENLAKSNVGKTNTESLAARTGSVDLSTRAQDLKKAKELATPSSGVDEAKVARLQSLIDSGQYKVNAEAIADRILDEHSKML